LQKDIIGPFKAPPPPTTPKSYIIHLPNITPNLRRGTQIPLKLSKIIR